MTLHDTLVSNLKTYAARGVVIVVTPTNTLQVRPASLLTPEDRGWFCANAKAIIGLLNDTRSATAQTAPSCGEPWDEELANELVENAKLRLKRSGLTSNHQELQDGIAMLANAFATRDLETVRFAVTEFQILVREIGGRETIRQATESHAHRVVNVAVRGSDHTRTTKG